MWRGSLLPLECGALPKPGNPYFQKQRLADFTTASQPSGSKLPRHKVHPNLDVPRPTKNR
ncbi:hypothetical protein C1884_07945 [Pseudomonas sp. GW460-R15]|nr:hypothetical protein C1887_09435 [Pseudomonas sp. GW456-R21]POA68785.1 hypothetical protein C1884_07945 [Pseudomonas sp. GW460-R15]